MRLIRGFVGTEARVAIDAIHGFTRLGDVVRGEGSEARIEGLNKLLHRSLHLLLVARFVFVEPVAIVIALQLAEEGEGGFGESGKAGRHLFNVSRLNGSPVAS